MLRPPPNRSDAPATPESAEVTTEQLNEFYRRNEKRLGAINQDIIDSDFTPIRWVYIDSVVLVDTRMGLLLATADRETTKYLEMGLHRYNHRLKRDFTCAYPALPYKEDQYRAWYCDPKYAYDIVMHSPTTSLAYHLVPMIKRILDHNRRAEYEEAVQITINTYPLPVTSLMQAWVGLVQNEFPITAVRFHLVSEDASKWSKAVWSRYDAMYVDDFGAMLRWPVFCQLATDELRWFKGYITAVPAIDDGHRQQWDKAKLDWTDPEKFHTLIAPTELVLNATVCTHFTFLSATIPIIGTDGSR